MKDEQKLWRNIRPMFRGMATRIECYVNSGIPDVVQICGGFTNWIELKCIQDNGKVILRKEQYGWGMRASLCGGRVFVIAARRHLPPLALWRFPIVCEPVGDGGKYVTICGTHTFMSRDELCSLLEH